MNTKHLKARILDLALQGKLVENSKIPNDLNSRIPTDFNPPFGIPNSWAWVKLGDLGEYKKGPFGSSLTKSIFVPKSENSIKVYEQKNAIQKNFELGDYFITKEYFLEKMQGFIVKPNDIIISCAGTIGEVYRIPKEAPQGIINQALMRVRLNDLTIFEWFIVAFNFVITANSHQAKGTAIKNIPPFYILKSLYIPLPPKNEQEFIVNELERLMSLADSYEVEFQKLENCKKELRNLKKSLLNYAISGKLSTNWRKENPNSRIPNDLNSRIPTDFKPPFGIPNSCAWVKLGDICDFQNGFAFKSKDFKNSGYFVIKIANIQNNEITKENAVFCEPEICENLENFSVKKGDILIAMSGATTGKIGIYNLDEKAFLNQRVGLFKNFSKNIDKRFFYFVLLTKVEESLKIAIGSAQPNLSTEQIKSYYIPLPPKDEQERIVKKIDELFEILEVIENSL